MGDLQLNPQNRTFIFIVHLTRIPTPCLIPDLNSTEHDKTELKIESPGGKSSSFWRASLEAGGW